MNGPEESLILLGDPDAVACADGSCDVPVRPTV
jgi:hypothetical protein